MSALAAMQDKTTHLENSLSAETRLKLDLFSALGEAKRQMEILQGKNWSCLNALFFLIQFYVRFKIISAHMRRANH